MGNWHGPLPSDDGWRQVTLASTAALGQRLWLRCNGCGHDLTPEPAALGAAHGLAPETPLLIIARRLVCTRCRARKAHCWPEPYGIGQEQLDGVCDGR